MAAVLTIMVFVGSNTSAKVIELEQSQITCINIAYTEGNKIQLFGEGWGETAAAVMYQESWCNSNIWQKSGVVVGDLNRKGKPKSLGPSQIQVATARFINTKYPRIFKKRYGKRVPSDEELTIDLLIDIPFNIKLGVRYFSYLLELKRGDVDAAILAYNRGPHGLIDVNNYVQKVKKWRTTHIRPFLRGHYKIVKREI
jgi:hypothetical protein